MKIAILLKSGSFNDSLLTPSGNFILENLKQLKIAEDSRIFAISLGSRANFNAVLPALTAAADEGIFLKSIKLERDNSKIVPALAELLTKIDKADLYLSTFEEKESRFLAEKLGFNFAACGTFSVFDGFVVPSVPDEKIQLPYPALLHINAEKTEMKPFSMPDIMAAAEKPYFVLSEADLNKNIDDLPCFNEESLA